MPPFIPHTEQDSKDMLTTIGVDDIQDLFDEIPASLRVKNWQEANIPAGMNEMELMQHAKSLASRNTSLTSFLGAGSYDHHIPAAVWDITSRGEFLTSYTPYQAEASQGTLQLLYEFQTMIAQLTGLSVANASLYDGATALAEAVLMAARIQKQRKIHRILVPDTLHPHVRATLHTIVSQQQIELVPVAFDQPSGIIPLNNLNEKDSEEYTALIIPMPNFFGCLEDVHALTQWAEQHDILTIAYVNPTALALITPPGQWGAHGVDIACGEGQPLGVPMAFGGPYFGFLSCQLAHVRQMPGRIVGRTVDNQGREGFTLTLQAREQHIRRGKATSNICTNQGLAVTAATIHMSLLGPKGLRAVADSCHQHTQMLVHALCQIEGVHVMFQTPFFHEALIQLPQPVAPILKQLLKQGILGGLSIEPYYENLPNTLLVCATEKRTADEIACFRQQLLYCLQQEPCPC